MAGKLRLDKFLTEMGLGTRSQVKDMAKKGRIQVNHVTVTKTDEKIDPEKDMVTCDGAQVAYSKYEYYMLNKPQGVVSATEDSLHETVIDLLMKKPAKQEEKADKKASWEREEGEHPKRKDLFPVGRLDIDTEGLLLITNDGILAHNLLSPKRHVDKRYFAKVDGILPDDSKERFQEGLTLLDGTKVLPAKLEILSKGEKAEVILTIHEGKFHQVKRMFEALGCQVVFLKRLSMGSLELDESLKPGEYRPLSAEERKELTEKGTLQL